MKEIFTITLATLTIISALLIPTKNVSSEVNLEEFKKIEKEESHKKEIRDPFASKATEKFTRGELKLFGIIYSKSFSGCLINDRVLFEGDEIAGKKIIKINKNNVLLEGAGSSIILNI